MATLTIIIECDNASFIDNGLPSEIRNCLQQVPEKLYMSNEGKIKDSNGNTVGQFKLNNKE